MMWYKKLILVLGFLIVSLLPAQSCSFDDFVNDLSQGGTTFKTIVDKEDGFKAWQILAKEAPALRKNANELNLVSKNLDAIENAGGYTKWKSVGSNLDFSTMDIPGALQHVKFRDLSNLSKRDIVGLHDAVEFFKLRIIKAIGNRNFQFPVGKTLDEVDEIVILAEANHPTTPGVRIIEYRVPSTDGKLTQNVNGVDVSKGYTTGATKGLNITQDYVKTIYDPKIWSDTKLEKALKEALQDAFLKEGNFINGKSYVGKSIEGYDIEFWYRDNKVQTFYFK